MSFLNKLKFSNNIPAVISSTSGDSTEREYFPEKIGIYCIDNPKLDKRTQFPKKVGIPPFQVTKKFVYKDAQFSNQSAWLGKLYAEPIVITMYRYDPFALYRDTKTRIFPSASLYDKRIPFLEDCGIEIPEFYDLSVPLEKRLTDITETLGKTKNKELIKQLKDEKAKLEANDEGVTNITVTKRVKEEVKIFLPIITAIKSEDEDSEGNIKATFTPKVVLFQVSPGVGQAEALVSNGILENKYDMDALTSYLIGDLGDVSNNPNEDISYNQAPLLLFENNLANKALTAINFPEDIKKSVAPYFEATLDKKISYNTFLKVIVLEILGLYPKKEEKDSLEDKLKQFVYKMK